jgi:cysteine desulfurase
MLGDQQDTMALGQADYDCKIMQIYLDYSATTPTRPESIAAIQAGLSADWGNPSSLHQWGERAALVLEKARLQVAGLINADPEGIIFTSGGTESNNLALLGVAKTYDQPQHLIISSVEHAAISQPAAWLQTQGWQVTILSVDRFGSVDPLDLIKAMQSNTVLVSIIYGQSEVGTVQPIAALAAICHEAGVLFHTDAIQAVGRIPIDVQRLGVDLLSLSGHKFYGGGGIGALYMKPGVKLSPLLLGGGQEMGGRAGTQPIAQIAGLGVAAALAAPEISTEMPRLIGLRDRLFQLLGDRSDLKPTGHPTQRLPHHLSFCLPAGMTGRQMVRSMNLAGIGISAGSACSSGRSNPSAVLLAMGFDPIIAVGGIRITLGRLTTEADIDWTAMVLGQILASQT